MTKIILLNIGEQDNLIGKHTLRIKCLIWIKFYFIIYQ